MAGEAWARMDQVDREWLIASGLRSGARRPTTAPRVLSEGGRARVDKELWDEHCALHIGGVAREANGYISYVGCARLERRSRAPRR